MTTSCTKVQMNTEAQSEALCCRRWFWLHKFAFVRRSLRQWARLSRLAGNLASALDAHVHREDPIPLRAGKYLSGGGHVRVDEDSLPDMFCRWYGINSASVHMHAR